MMNARPLLLLFIVSSLNLCAQETEESTYGDNLISFSPAMVYGSDWINDFGIGLSYERFLSEHISLTVPFSYGFDEDMLQAGVGVKIYPTGHDRSIKYSVAPTLLYTRGNDQYYYYYGFEDGLYLYSESDRTVSQLGFMLTNSLNITLNESFYLGLDAGFGINYLTWIKDGSRTREYGPDINGLFRTSLGYRF